MSDILIYGMKMPERCYDCPLCYDYLRCEALEEELSTLEAEDGLFEPADMRAKQCPLVEIKTPHGRLIDAEEAIEKARKTKWTTFTASELGLFLGCECKTVVRA